MRWSRRASTPWTWATGSPGAGPTSAAGSPWRSTTACARSWTSPTFWRSAGVPATVFLVTDRIGRDNDWPGQPRAIPRAPLLAWSDLDALAAAGFRFAAHGRTHCRLDRCDDADARERAPRLARRDRTAAGPSLPAARLSLRPGAGAGPAGGDAAFRRRVRHPARRRDGHAGPLRHRADRRLLPPLAPRARPAPDRPRAALAPAAADLARGTRELVRFTAGPTPGSAGRIEPLDACGPHSGPCGDVSKASPWRRLSFSNMKLQE